jgi:hypothetical protein
MLPGPPRPRGPNWATKRPNSEGKISRSRVEISAAAARHLVPPAVARARPDGYTILLGGTLPHVNEALPFLGSASNKPVLARIRLRGVSDVKHNRGRIAFNHATSSLRLLLA